MNSTDKKLIGCLALLVGAILISDNGGVSNINKNISLKNNEEKNKKDIILINEVKEEFGLIRTGIKSVGLNIKKFWKWIY
jgi:hypothetical protein